MNEYIIFFSDLLYNSEHMSSSVIARAFLSIMYFAKGKLFSNFLS